MKNATDDQIARYLGDSSPTDFDSETEILAYFELENLIYMWGPGDYIDREDVEEAVVLEWRKSRPVEEVSQVTPRQRREAYKCFEEA